MTLNPDWGTNPLTGGTITIDGIPITVPGNLTATLPALSVAWSELFIKTDTTTLGSWKGVYGADGYSVVNDLASAPSYVTMTPSGNSPWTWAGSSTDPRALQKPSSPSDRLAACWYAPGSMSFDLSFTDQQPHQVALYLMDWDRVGRVDRVDILDVNNNVLDSRVVSGFGGGQYWVWNLSGHVTVRLTTGSQYNAVVSGVFFR